MTYEYVCTACDHNWEAEQPISAAPLKACPICQKETAKRQVSGGAGFILKGSGWYADLYSSPKPGKDKEKGSETKEGSKDDSKSESKSESKGESKSESKKDGAPGAASSSPSSASSGSGDSSSSATSGPTPTKPANAAAS